MRFGLIRRRPLAWALAVCVGGSAVAIGLGAPPFSGPAAPEAGAPAPMARFGAPTPAPLDSPNVAAEPSLNDLLGTEVLPIDFAGALRLGGVRNPQILLARQRVVEAAALRQLAAAQLLPSLNLGTSFDNHNGNVQQSGGNMLKVNRSSVYVGAGAYAIAAGTVNIPGVVLSGNVAEVYYNAVAARQLVTARGFASRAAENEMLRQVATAYLGLLRAEGTVAITRRNYDNAREVARITEAFAKAGAGREADANRARSDRDRHEAELRLAEGTVPIASARLAELLDIPPTTRLRPTEEHVVPAPVVPDPIPLPELLAIAALNRPELAERQALIRRAVTELQGAKMLPFSPNVILGLSYGGEAGGSNLVHVPEGPGAGPFARGDPRFGLLSERLDFDAIAFWTLQNLGIGNRAMINAARARLGTTRLEFLERLNRVRAEVASAHARSHARFAQIATSEKAMRESNEAFEADLRAVQGNIGRPVELLESLRLLARARLAYLDAIIAYNQAQLDLYVALGQPPADTLARPVPPNFAPPPAPAPAPPEKKGPGR